jgi:YbbR domain-containing protein
MKNKIKSTISIIFLALLAYLLFNKKNNNISTIRTESTILIDKKSSISPAPKVYISTLSQNGLEVGSNWKSK